MKKRILFIQPPFERFMNYSRFYNHPGLLSLAAVVEARGHEALIYDADYNPQGISYNPMEMLDRYDGYIEGLNQLDSPIWTEVRKVIHEYKPDFLGITVLTPTVDSFKNIVKIGKEVFRNIQVIAGGAHATLSPHDLVGYADYVVQYEGESEIVEIMEGKRPKGIIQGQRIQDLDVLPLPAIHLIRGLDEYEKRDLSMVMSTRGCPNDCKFCNSAHLWKRKVTRKSVGRFMEEIKILKDHYGVDDFFIADDSFTYHSTWLKEFCREISKLDVTWRCLTRIDHIHEEMLDEMYHAGCRNIKFGIESGSPRILESVNKKIKIEDVLKASDLLQRKRMNWSAYFMIGFPGETEEDICKTQDLMKQISSNSITLSVFTPFPQNELYKNQDPNYSLYSHHSPNNNFTGTIQNQRFRELVRETLELSFKGYIEHNSFKV